MTIEEIANKWQMNRYRTPGQIGGMDNREYFDLLQTDISECVEQESIAFVDWINGGGSDGRLTSFNGFWSISGSKEQDWIRTAELYQLYKKSNENSKSTS